MGRSTICNYEVQTELCHGQYHVQGAMSYKEALTELLNEAQRIGSVKGYIWPQTKMAKKKVNNIPWVNNHNGIDYLEITIEINTPERRKYKISGKNCGEEMK